MPPASALGHLAAGGSPHSATRSDPRRPLSRQLLPSTGSSAETRLEGLALRENCRTRCEMDMEARWALPLWGGEVVLGLAAVRLAASWQDEALTSDATHAALADSCAWAQGQLPVTRLSIRRDSRAAPGSGAAASLQGSRRGRGTEGGRVSELRRLVGGVGGLAASPVLSLSSVMPACRVGSWSELVECSVE